MKLSKAQYLENESIIFLPDTTFQDPVITIMHLESEIRAEITKENDGYHISPLPAGGYGILIKDATHREETAFDVVRDPREVVRYGFLSDFTEKDSGCDDVEWMKDLHLNAVQFYDWMYKHDDLISPEKIYTDPLGRETSLSTIEEKIAACKERGIRPFAYGAVYAATRSTYEKHPEWSMYTTDHSPMTFADWLYYMNIASSCKWSEHILKEFENAIRFGFSGIHMDTYGFPKHVRDFDGNVVDLENEFPGLIDKAADAVSQNDPDAGVIFNAVNNWPIETVATSKQDSLYIEVWPPHDTYYDLYTLVREARLLSHKNVILAAYLKAFKEENVAAAERSFKLTFATICASGGTQLILGENKCILSDSYYADHSQLSDDFCAEVQKYCDHLVRYNELLYNDTGMDISKTASDGINEDIRFLSSDARFSSNGASNSVWTIIRESARCLSINLINLSGIDNIWNAPKEEPKKTGPITVLIRLDKNTSGFYMASPDDTDPAPVSLPFTIREDTSQGRIYEITVPTVRYWTTLWAHMEE